MSSVYVRYTLTFNSYTPTPIPELAPLPASPTKCILPILLANIDAPTCNVNVILSTT